MSNKAFVRVIVPGGHLGDDYFRLVPKRVCTDLVIPPGVAIEFEAGKVRTDHDPEFDPSRVSVEYSPLIMQEPEHRNLLNEVIRRIRALNNERSVTLVKACMVT
jgi:hypothetical protein